MFGKMSGCVESTPAWPSSKMPISVDYIQDLNEVIIPVASRFVRHYRKCHTDLGSNTLLYSTSLVTFNFAQNSDSYMRSRCPPPPGSLIHRHSSVSHAETVELEKWVLHWLMVQKPRTKQEINLLTLFQARVMATS